MAQQQADSTFPQDSPAHAAATARTLLGYSVEGAAEALGMTASLLRDVESGTIPVSPEIQARMEAVYEMSLEGLIERAPKRVPRTPMAYDEERGILRVGTLGVRFNRETDGNDVLLRGFSSAVRRQRQVPPSVPLRLRRLDLPVLAELLDLDDPELDDRARFWFGQTPETAQSFRAMLRAALAIGEIAPLD